MVIAVGLILGLGLYTEATGPLGRAMADLVGRLVGRARFLAPVGLLLWGYRLLRVGPSTRKRTRRTNATERLAIGAMVAAIFSLLDLIGGQPTYYDSVEELGRAGGYVGVATGGTIWSYVGSAGQAIVTFTLFVLAVLMLTSLSVGLMVEKTVDRITDWLPDLTGIWDRYDRWPRSAQLEKLDGPAPKRRRMPVFGSERPPEDPADDDSETYIDLSEGSDQPASGFADDVDQDLWGDQVEPSPNADNQYDDPSLDAEQWNADHEPFIEVPKTSVADRLVSAAPSPAEGGWVLPAMNILLRSDVQDVDRAAVEARGRQLEFALAEHGVETRLIGVVVGPTVSRFELELGPGVKVSKVTNLHKDIAYSMATPDVRILAPVPGKQAIGVEVPNLNRQIICVGDLLVSEEAGEATHPLEVTLGRDITGRTIMVNLAKMPHILVAGQTGSGKSSSINSMLTSILMRSTPDQVRLILVDPKQVELTQYERLPHLLTEVVTDPKKASNALAWAVREMERRYDLLKEVGVRDLDGYNSAVESGRLQNETVDGRLPFDENSEPDTSYQKLSYILIVLDELADLMMVAARDIEESICRIAQKARAVGIHLVIATQRPSTNVITGLIKANVPARLAFAVSSLTDSRVILDQPGAERLVGRGDGLLNDGTTSTPVRFQGAWVTEGEVSTIVDHWVQQSPEIVYDSRVQHDEVSEAAQAIPGGTTGDEGDDELLVQAMELVVRSQLGSTSMLQRKLRVGFARAGRLMDLLEERGIVGPSIGSKAREVKMTPEDLDAGRMPAPTQSSTGSIRSPGPRQPQYVNPAPDRRPSPNDTAHSNESTSGPGGLLDDPIEPRPRRKTLADLQLPDPFPAGNNGNGGAERHSPSAPGLVEREPSHIDDDLYDDADFDEGFVNGHDPALDPPPGYNGR